MRRLEENISSCGNCPFLKKQFGKYKCGHKYSEYMTFKKIHNIKEIKDDCPLPIIKM